MHPWPARMDPFHAFASYPTQALTPQTLLSLVEADIEMALKRAMAYRQLAMIDFAKAILPSDEEIQSIFKYVGMEKRPAIELIWQFHPERRPFLFRSLSWL